MASVRRNSARARPRLISSSLAEGIRMAFELPATPRYIVDEIPDVDWVVKVQSCLEADCGTWIRSEISLAYG